MATNNRITPSKRDIYLKLLDIAEKYVDIKDTDFLKAGLFGYITESAAMVARDSALHKTMAYNESFLNKAILPESIYNWAKTFSIDIDRAQPSYANILLTFTRSDVESTSQFMQPAVEIAEISEDKYGMDVRRKGGKSCLVIDKSNPIIAGAYTFSLEHSILLVLDGDRYYAQYILTEDETTSYQNLQSQMLPVIINGETLSIKARAYQYSIKKKKVIVPSGNFLNSVHTFEFENQLSGCKLFYSTNSQKREEIELRYSELKNSNNKKFAYYSLIDEHTIEVQFSTTAGGFSPPPNSTLEMEIYETNGANVPNKFTDNALIQLDNNNASISLRSLPITVEFDPVTIFGGVNAPALEEIKKKIISEISTRNVIITEDDLNRFFSIVTTLVESINGGKIKFIKKRDDILERSFNAYILMRQNSNTTDKTYLSKCIPSNTLDVIDVPANGSTDLDIDFGSKIILDTNSGKYIRSDDIHGDDYYFSPFYINVYAAPFRKAKYIYPLTDDSTVLVYGENFSGDSTSGEFMFVPETCSVKRGYNDSFEVGDLKVIFTFLTSESFNTAPSNVSLIFRNSGEVLDNTINFSSENIRVLSSKISDESDSSYRTTFEFSLKRPDSGKLFQTIDDKTFTYISSGDQVSKRLADFAKFTLSFNSSEITSERNIAYAINGTLEASRELRCFKDLDSIMRSDVSVVPYGENNYFQVKDVPLIHSSYQFIEKADESGETSSDILIKQIFNYTEVLEENREKLENSTNFNMKFYNTYGLSNLYNTTTTNITLDLEIIYYEDMVDDTFREAVIDYIRRAVDMYNDNEAIKIVDLLVLLKQEKTFGDYIHDINIYGLNGSLSSISALNVKKELYTPEWLNLDSSTIDLSKENNLTIKFVPFKDV